MFANCTSLTETPELPATIVGDYAYGYMFAGCTSLTKIPVLSAEILGISSYRHMFSECSNLTGSINLPAKNVPEYCYSYLLSGCSQVTGISVDFTNWYVETEVSGQPSSILITEGWTSGVSSIGKFTCPNELEIKRGINYIPENWEILDNSYLPNRDELTPLTFTCVNSASPTTIKLSISGELKLDNIYYRIKLNNATEYSEWTKYTIGEELKCTKLNDEIQFKNLDDNLSLDEKNFAYFSTPARTDVLKFLVHYNQC